MGGVTVLIASYAGAASAPAYARLAGLAAELPGEQLVRRDAGWPVLLYADPLDATLRGAIAPGSRCPRTCR